MIAAFEDYYALRQKRRQLAAEADEYARLKCWRNRQRVLERLALVDDLIRQAEAEFRKKAKENGRVAWNNRRPPEQG